MTLLRASICLSAFFGTMYITWRWLFSLNMHAWWIAVPLVLSESYSVIDSAFFSFTVWGARTREAPPPPIPGLTIDIFITTYNEPIEIVAETARAAREINYPHLTWILDDGARDEMRKVAEELGVGYITRSEEWRNQPRHAKAGNVNNALMQTSGEFILILDSDQVPLPDLLDHTLGYFKDPKVALVQTPQEFGNVSTSDPLGSNAPLFYGPIQQGKDFWNAAYFCGSNAILRREALMQLGIKRYVIELESSTKRALRSAGRVIKRARKELKGEDIRLNQTLIEIAQAIESAKKAINRGVTIGQATFELHAEVQDISNSLVARDLVDITTDLSAMQRMDSREDPNWAAENLENIDLIIDALTQRELSPLIALESVMNLLRALDVNRAHEAIPIMPIATISITEDMATSMRLHEMKWRSVYHHEILAIGLAPEDIGSMLSQRLRWAQGTMQVLLRENPLIQKGLSWPQRLMYFSTMWSYFSGFAAIFYFAAPIIYLCFGILPVKTSPLEFFIRFIPFMIANQLIFYFASRGISTWRGQQYSYALFPIWIKATTSALANVLFRRPMNFVVTPKTRVEAATQWRLIRYQLVVGIAFFVALIIGIIRFAIGQAPFIATAINILWVIFDLSLLKVLIPAVRYGGSAHIQPSYRSKDGHGNNR